MVQVKDFKYHYKGILEWYFETGMEGYAPIIADERGFSTGPSFNNDTKKWDGPPQQYRSLEWSYWFEKHKPCHLKVYSPEGNVLFDGPVTRNLKAMSEHKYFFHYLPNEVEFKTWLQWCKDELKAEVWTDTPAHGEPEAKELEAKRFAEHQKNLVELRAKLKEAREEKVEN